MKLTPSKLNKFLMFKLPSAYLTGVRVTSISDQQCTVTVKHKWISQNPFNSMFWAVQGMAAELTTGALMMMKIKQSGRKISMLVANNKANFSKKATGKITFSCDQGSSIDQAITRAIETGEGQTVWLNSKGINADGMEVSDFHFEWTIKVKN